MIDKAYLVVISSGGVWDSYDYTIFVTKDKEYAEKWVKKYNGLVDKWSKYFDDLMKSDESFVMKSDWAFDRYELFRDLKYNVYDKLDYENTLYRHCPIDTDYEYLPYGEKRHVWLDIVYDAFNEICNRYE